jgi:hypothetical protein
MTAEPTRSPARTIRVDGVFDVPAAQRLARALADAGGCGVHVDLEHVREFHDLAVVQLARALAGRVEITVSGLRQHHLRLLRYLGFDPGPLDLPPPDGGDPAELR